MRSPEMKYAYADSVIALWRQYERCESDRKGQALAKMSLQAIVADCTAAIDGGHDDGDPGWFAGHRVRALRLLIA